MEPIEIVADFYSPRWGHDDRYRFSLSMEQMSISHGARTRVAHWQQGGDPIWEGDSLVKIMNNDSIYPPDGVESLMAYIWVAWRNGEIDDKQAQNELHAFADYINSSTRAKPRTKFWEGIF